MSEPSLLTRQQPLRVFWVISDWGSQAVQCWGEKGLCVHVRSRRLPFSNLTSWAVPRWKGWLRRGFYCRAAATWCWLQRVHLGALRRLSSAVFSLSKCWEKWVKWSSVLVLHLTGDGRCKSALFCSWECRPIVGAPASAGLPFCCFKYNLSNSKGNFENGDTSLSESTNDTRN